MRSHLGPDPWNGLIIVLPTAPRWLFQHDRHQEGTEILRRLQSSNGQVNEVVLATTIREISDALALESEQKGWMDLLRDDHIRSRRRVALACLLNACQAWSGSTPISYYTTVMYESSRSTISLKIANIASVALRTQSVLVIISLC